MTSVSKPQVSVPADLENAEAADREKPYAGILRLGTFNVRHGLGADGQIDLKRTAQAISALDCDLVALQEIDVCTERSGGIDQAAVLGKACGMHVSFGSALSFQGGRYGNAVLARLPILRQHLVDLPGKEPRCLLAADVMWNGRLIRFASIHLDLDAVMRNLAVEKLLDSHLLRGGDITIVAGDFNATPREGAIQRLRNSWSCVRDADLHPSFPADRPERRIDYIFGTGQGRGDWLEERVVADAVTSDHRPISAVLGVS